MHWKEKSIKITRVFGPSYLVFFNFYFCPLKRYGNFARKARERFFATFSKGRKIWWIARKLKKFGTFERFWKLLAQNRGDRQISSGRPYRWEWTGYSPKQRPSLFHVLCVCRAQVSLHSVQTRAEVWVAGSVQDGLVYEGVPKHCCINRFRRVRGCRVTPRELHMSKSIISTSYHPRARTHAQTYLTLSPILLYSVAFFIFSSVPANKRVCRVSTLAASTCHMIGVYISIFRS